MSRPSSTPPICAAQWKMCLIKVFCVIYFTAICAADEGENVTEMLHHMTEVTVAPTVYEPPTPYLQNDTAWLDVFPNEKVEFSCDISDRSDWNIIWHRDTDELKDANEHVSISTEGSVLTITAAASMAGTYFCKGLHKTKGVNTPNSNSLEVEIYGNPNLTVTRTPDFDQMFPGESVTFTCSVDESSGWEYLWYHNGTEIQASNADSYTITSLDHSKNGEYRCKAKRGKEPFYTGESILSLQVSDPPTVSATLQSPWPDVFSKEEVILRCEGGNSKWVYTWYKDGQKLTQESWIYKITSATQTDQGGYACKAHLESRSVSSGFSNTIHVKVYENTPTPTLSKSPPHDPMYVGETVTFTCTVSMSSGWSYQWYKDKLSLPANGNTSSITLTVSDGGQYSCKATRSVTTSTSYSEQIPLDVREIPVPSLKNMTQWLDVFPTESVKFSCNMTEGSGWKYTWERNGEKIQPDNDVSFEASAATLFISSASAKHKGQYQCKGHLEGRSVQSSSSAPLTLEVHDEKPRLILTQDPEYSVMFPRESVSYSCHINVSSGWEYVWYKNTDELPESERMYSINSVGTAHSGSYKCKAKRGESPAFNTDSSQAIKLEVKEKKPKAVITQNPDVNEVYNGESVSLKCEIPDSSGWEYKWYKDEVPLLEKHEFTIHNASLSDSGTYKCVAKRDKSEYDAELSKQDLHIIGIPDPFLKSVTQWLDVFPSESMKMQCEMNGSINWKYTWYKDGQEVQPGNAVFFDADQTTLSINSASASHRGQYTCSAKLKSRQVKSTISNGLKLSVYDVKPAVTVVQNPEHNDMHTGDSVSFTCHINVSSGWEYLWYKDNIQLTESGGSHNISSVVTANTGSYVCQVKRGTNAVFLSDKSRGRTVNIAERPQAKIILKTGWSEAFSTDTLVLKCEVMVEGKNWTWNYTWIMGETKIGGMSDIHYVTPQSDPDQSSYTCSGVRKERPSYSKSSDPFKTKNLLLKRRVLLSISGCIFFGLIAVFLGCIALRVFRKPVHDEDKPEDENLFLTMAQMKDRTDVPCPLVEYISDAALISPSKEGDENGTICSETTPLPITTAEEQAVTTESHDTEENNGGLASFKQ